MQDPESLLGKVEDGLIARRMRAKEAEEEAKAEDEAKAAWKEEREKLLAMRAARIVPMGALPSCPSPSPSPQLTTLCLRPASCPYLPHLITGGGSPDDHAALAQYFFDTELNEMEYECTRCRPQLVNPHPAQSGSSHRPEFSRRSLPPPCDVGLEEWHAFPTCFPSNRALKGRPSTPSSLSFPSSP